MINILSYYPHQIEKINCLDETELASGKTLKSREIFRKAVFLAECVECSINVTNWQMYLDTDMMSLSRHSSKFTIFVT